ncbi:unnamed protein product [Psylliodes chrysocephalus]|uniref:Tesmin/TSO1-like CXC domain-containing protein n=1 Tax=Psylliodes chrysocephalus TaxID=3402493 RepID=A0A9P0D2K4_9CUCU|nr:unnamed protein product [Psylliodes chrysocephala]
MSSGSENTFSNCIITCTIIGTTGNLEKSFRNYYSGVLGAAELYSGIIITRGWLCGGAREVNWGRNGSVHESRSKLVTGFWGCLIQFWHWKYPGVHEGDNISCSCQTDCGTRCGCRRKGLECSLACKHCDGINCSNQKGTSNGAKDTDEEEDEGGGEDIEGEEEFEQHV